MGSSVHDKLAPGSMFIGLMQLILSHLGCQALVAGTTEVQACLYAHTIPGVAGLFIAERL